MRIVVVGSLGQLGREVIANTPDHDVIGLSRSDLDLQQPDSVAPMLRALRPDLVLNATAENRVDLAESDPATAVSVNAHAVGVLARACRELDAFFAHVSTDYVFDGTATAPYTEDDPPNPQSAYGRTKLAGELLARATTPRHAIVRVAGLYAHGGSRGKGGSFIDKILAQARSGKPLRVVADQVTAPTWARDVATALSTLMPRWVAGTAPTGIYHATNTGSCSWHAFATAIVHHAGVAVPVEATSSAAFAAPAPRPAHSVLANTRFQALGLPPLPHWEDALRRYLAETPTERAAT